MRRHSFDAFSFVLGAMFAAIGTAFLFGNVDLGDLHLAGFWPLPLILIGVLMLVSTIQRRSRPAPVPAPPPGVSASPTSYESARTAHIDQPRTAAATADQGAIEPVGTAEATADSGEFERVEPAATTADSGDIEPVHTTAEIDGLEEDDSVANEFEHGPLVLDDDRPEEREEN